VAADEPPVNEQYNTHSASIEQWFIITTKIRVLMYDPIILFTERATFWPSAQLKFLGYRRFQVACENENYKRDQTRDLWYEYLELATILVNNLLAKPDVL